MINTQHPVIFPFRKGQSRTETLRVQGVAAILIVGKRHVFAPQLRHNWANAFVARVASGRTAHRGWEHRADLGIVIVCPDRGVECRIGIQVVSRDDFGRRIPVLDDTRPQGSGWDRPLLDLRGSRKAPALVEAVEVSLSSQELPRK